MPLRAADGAPFSLVVPTEHVTPRVLIVEITSNQGQTRGNQRRHVAVYRRCGPGAMRAIPRIGLGFRANRRFLRTGMPYCRPPSGGIMGPFASMGAVDSRRV